MKSKAALKNEKRKQKKIEEQAAGEQTAKVEAVTHQVQAMKVAEVWNTSLPHNKRPYPLPIRPS